MNKYPVIYDGEEYEVVWYEDPSLLTIILYKIRKNKFLFKKNLVYDKWECEIDDKYSLDSDSANYRIEQVKSLLKEYANFTKRINTEEIIKQKQINALDKWDGVIE